MFPVIGITSSTKIFGTGVYDIVLRSYAKAIEDNHGVPLILPLVWHSRIRQEIFSLLDGLLLTGGADLDPGLYNDEIISVEELDKDKDDFELSITKFALRNKIPILGIGRGLHLLSVAFGGALCQDIPQNEVIHRQNLKLFRDGALQRNEHTIYLCSKTRLMDIYGKKILTVTSSHHQAVKEMPKGLVLSAYAEDGTIEAVEKEGGEHFCIGVQFHPEEMHQDIIQQKLFKAFIAAAYEYRLKGKAVAV